MNPNPEEWKLPVLASVSGPGLNLKGHRELSDEELILLEQYKNIAVSARNRFKLYAILKRNYEEWWEYSRSLLQPKGNLDSDEMVELDRLLLNYFSSAKSVIDHFRQHWVQNFRKTDEEKKYDEYLAKLETESWAFAFFQDLRNFTQHCGLPVGNYNRNVNHNSVTLKIEADSQWLTQHFNGWKKSKLDANKGKLDLLILAQEYYIRLHRDLGGFLANAFAPQLLDAHNFFAGFADEVKQDNPNAQYRILTGFTRDGEKINFQFSLYPTDLMGSLGISLSHQTNNHSEQ